MLAYFKTGCFFQCCHYSERNETTSQIKAKSNVTRKRANANVDGNPDWIRNVLSTCGFLIAAFQNQSTGVWANSGGKKRIKPLQASSGWVGGRLVGWFVGWLVWRVPTHLKQLTPHWDPSCVCCPSLSRSSSPSTCWSLFMFYLFAVYSFCRKIRWKVLPQKRNKSAHTNV